MLIGFGEPRTFEILPGIEAHILKKRFSRGFLFYLDVQLQLFFYLIRQSMDAICACDADTIMPGFYAARRKGVKIIFDGHEYFSETSGVQGRKFVKTVWSWVEKRYIPRVDLAYTVSPGLAEIMGDRFHIHFGLVRNLPKKDAADEDTEWPYEKGSFWIYQGYLNKGRGLEEIVRAFSVSGKKLLIAGVGPRESVLKDLIREHGMEDKVEMLGRIEPKKLKSLTSLAFAGLNIVDGEGLSYHYSLANKFFDYLQAGIPQVNSNLPEYKRICERFDCSLFLESNTVEELQKAIEKMEADQQAYAKLQYQARQASKVFNWESEEIELLSLYESLF